MQRSSWFAICKCVAEYVQEITPNTNNRSRWLSCHEHKTKLVRGDIGPSRSCTAMIFGRGIFDHIKVQAQMMWWLWCLEVSKVNDHHLEVSQRCRGSLFPNPLTSDVFFQIWLVKPVETPNIGIFAAYTWARPKKNTIGSFIRWHLPRWSSESPWIAMCGTSKALAARLERGYMELNPDEVMNTRNGFRGRYGIDIFFRSQICGQNVDALQLPPILRSLYSRRQNYGRKR